MSRKSTQAVILKRRADVARRYLRGDTQAEIAADFKVHFSQISRDLKVIQEEWLRSAKADRAEHIAKELARLEELERRAWTNLDKSEKNAETTKAKTTPKGPTAEKIIRGQSGDPRWAKIIVDCIEQRSKLLGLHGLTFGGDGANGQEMGNDDRTRLVAAIFARFGFVATVAGPCDKRGEEAGGSSAPRAACDVADLARQGDPMRPALGGPERDPPAVGPDAGSVASPGPALDLS